MKYVFTNGKILNGTKDMQVQEGQVILVENGRITGSCLLKQHAEPFF